MNHHSFEPASIRDLAWEIEPDLDVLSISHPQPILRDYNAVGVFRSQEDARNAVLAVESLGAPEPAVGMTTLGSSVHSDEVRDSSTDAAGVPVGADREGVVSDIVPRTIKGAVYFAALGAVLAGTLVVLFGDRELIVVGMVTAALFGAAVGAIWGAFVRMGLSDAYRESFVDPNSFETIIVSFHTDERSEAEEAASRLGLAAGHEAWILRFDEINDRTPER